MKRLVDPRTLTPEQFTAALDRLGWRQADFARRAGVAMQSVHRWASGAVAPPIMVTEYLQAMIELQALHERFVAPLRPARGSPDEPGEEQQPPSPGAD